MYTRTKNKREIKAMRESGRMLAAVLDGLADQIAPGMTGIDADQFARRELKGMGAKPAFLGYQGFPASICVSLNQAIVHGIPSAEPFQDGDIVSFDFGVNYKGMITDSARTFGVGELPAQTRELLEYTERSMLAGIDVMKDGVRTGDIAAAVQGVLDQRGYGIIRDLVGHGVGHELHEDPNIPNYGTAGTGDTLKSGMTIAIEPMATLGDWRIDIDSDGWTIRTRDGSLSAHFEHTVLITDIGAEILTRS